MCPWGWISCDVPGHKKYQCDININNNIITPLLVIQSTVHNVMAIKYM